MQLKRVSLTRFGVVIFSLIGILLVMSAMGTVQALPPLQAETATPLADDLANLGGSGACQEMFGTYYRWLDQGGKLRFYFVTNEYGAPNDDPARGNVASYATGELAYTGANTKQLSGTGIQYFNDRNLFDPKSADKIQLSISPEGILLTLLSWGNSPVNFTPPHCSNGALIALGEGNPNRNGDYKVMYIFTFHKG